MDSSAEQESGRKGNIIQRGLSRIFRAPGKTIVQETTEVQPI